MESDEVVARRQRRELRRLIESMGYSAAYAAQAVRQVDVSNPAAAELCFQWIEENPEEDDVTAPDGGRDALLEPLLQMGFTSEESEAALEETNNDVQRAVVLILSRKTKELQMAIADEDSEDGGGAAAADELEWPNYAGAAPPPGGSFHGGGHDDDDGGDDDDDDGAGSHSEEVRELTSQIMSLQKLVVAYQGKYIAVKRRKERRQSVGGDGDLSPPLAPPGGRYGGAYDDDEDDEFDGDDYYEDDDYEGDDFDEDGAPPAPEFDFGGGGGGDGGDEAPPPPPSGDLDDEDAPPPPPSTGKGAAGSALAAARAKVAADTKARKQQQQQQQQRRKKAGAGKADPKIPKRRNRRMLAMMADEEEKEKRRGPARGWVNEGNYRSIKVTVLESLEVASKVGKTWFTSGRVDSTSLRTEPRPTAEVASWTGDYFFPLAGTTQMIQIALHDGDSGGYIGMAHVPIEKLKQPADAKWFRLHVRRKSHYDELRSKAKLPAEVKLSVRFRTSGVAPGENEAAGTRTGRPPAGASAKSGGSRKAGSTLRFQGDGFDLDLSYVTDHVIAMAYPGTSIDGAAGNRTREVHAFLEARHKGRYQVLNLCAEGSYNDSDVGGRVARVPMPAGAAPRFADLVSCCKLMDNWLKGHPQSVMAVHCADGQDRTGVVVACYLLYSREVSGWMPALNLFGAMRSADGHSHCSPSGARLVRWFERFYHGGKGGRPLSDSGLARAMSVPPPGVELESVRVQPIPYDVRSEGTKCWLVLTQAGDPAFKFSTRKLLKPERDLGRDVITFRVPDEVRATAGVNDDFTVEVFYGSTMFKKVLFRFQGNTRFLQPVSKGASRSLMTLGKEEIDLAAADRRDKKFSPDTVLEATFRLLG